MVRKGERGVIYISRLMPSVLYYFEVDCRPAGSLPQLFYV